MKLSNDALRSKIEEFADALADFRSSPDRFKSFGISAKGQKISKRFFGLQDEVGKLGLALQKTPYVSNLTPLEAALFRWAVWDQTAGYTASLNLADPYTGKVGWPDSANIMTHLGIAEQALLDALDQE